MNHMHIEKELLPIFKKSRINLLLGFAFYRESLLIGKILLGSLLCLLSIQL